MQKVVVDVPVFGRWHRRHCVVLPVPAGPGPGGLDLEELACIGRVRPWRSRLRRACSRSALSVIIAATVVAVHLPLLSITSCVGS